MKVERIEIPPQVLSRTQGKDRVAKTEVETANAVDNDVSQNDDQKQKHQSYQRYSPQKQIIATDEEQQVQEDGTEVTEVKHLDLRA